MYRLGDERAAVREIQKYLHFVSDRVTDAVPRIAIDGFYGEETAEAVKAFQRFKGIEESGEVDYETFTLLYEEYKLSEAEEYVIRKESFPQKIGDSGNEALLINLMLYELGKIYKGVRRVDIKPYFSLLTEEAVRDIRKVYMLESIPTVDAFLYKKMRYELLLRAKDKK